MSLLRTTLTLSAALLGVALNSSADAGIWVELNGNTLEISMDDEAINVVFIEQLSPEKLKVGVAGMGGSYGGITVLFEKNYYFAVSDIKVIDIVGSDGIDLLWNASDLPSVMDGGGDDDLLVGGSNCDVLFGGDGDDELYGFEDNDQLYGEAGKDGVHGGAGKDILDLGGDSIEKFKIGGEDPDGFVRYGYFIGTRFRPARMQFDLSQFDFEGLPVVTETSDFNAAEGDYSINEEL